MNRFETQVAGTRMHGVVLGEGPPVVLVHGFGISGAYMLPLARALATSFTAFVPDLPGQGESGELRGRATLSRLAQALGRWVEANGLLRPAFVANSMGCQVVTELALRRPKLVGPMVLVGPTIDPARRDAPGQLLAAFRDALREPLGVLANAARDDAKAGVRMLYSLGRSVLDDRIEDRLPSLEQRAVVMHGENDAFGSEAWAERAASLLPNGQLLVVPGEPHSLHYTRPDLVVEVVTDLFVEEGDHRAGELVGRLEHGNVTARQQHEAGHGQGALPLAGEPVGDEVVALAPHE
jgi:2-hydroxy-6-oxonona-2,4-dienedioate hydrolase